MNAVEVEVKVVLPSDTVGAGEPVQGEVHIVAEVYDEDDKARWSGKRLPYVVDRVAVHVRGLETAGWSLSANESVLDRYSVAEYVQDITESHCPMPLSVIGDPVIIPFSTTVPPRDACTAASYLHSSGVQAIVQYGIRAFAFVRKESAEPLALEGELSYPDQNSVALGAWGPRHASVGESHAVLVGDPTAFSLFEKFGGLLHPLAVEDGFTPFLSTAPLCATLNIPSQAYNISHSVAASVVVHNRTNRDVRAIVVSLHRVVRLRARSACVGEGELFLTASTDSDWIEHVHEDMVSSVRHKGVDRGQSDERCIQVPLAEVLHPTVNGNLVNVHYKVVVSLEVAGLNQRTLDLQLPVAVYRTHVPDPPASCAPQIELEKVGAVRACEFSVPNDAGVENVVEGKRLMSGQAVKGQVFYQTNDLFFCDVTEAAEREVLTIHVHEIENSVALNAKYQEPPRFLTNDAQAKRTSSDHLMMKLSRHTTPRLRRGRWYFEVVGKSFMASSRYWVKYELKSEEVLRNERSFGSEVEEEVWENESRSTPFSTYGVQPRKRPRWSDELGNGLPHKEDIPLPDFNWKWSGPWEVDRQPRVLEDGSAVACDEEGWLYALQWTSGRWFERSNPTCFVRRRRWTRTRVIRQKEEKEQRMEMGADEGVLDDMIDEFELMESTPGAPLETPGKRSLDGGAHSSGGASSGIEEGIEAQSPEAVRTSIERMSDEQRAATVQRMQAEIESKKKRVESEQLELQATREEDSPLLDSAGEAEISRKLAEAQEAERRERELEAARRLKLEEARQQELEAAQQKLRDEQQARQREEEEQYRKQQEELEKMMSAELDRLDKLQSALAGGTVPAASQEPDASDGSLPDADSKCDTAEVAQDLAGSSTAAEAERPSECGYSDESSCPRVEVGAAIGSCPADGPLYGEVLPAALGTAEDADDGELEEMFEAVSDSDEDE